MAGTLKPALKAFAILGLWILAFEGMSSVGWAGLIGDDELPSSLRQLKTSEILNRLPDDYAVWRTSTSDEMRHYLFVRAYLEEFRRRSVVEFGARDAISLLNTISGDELTGYAIFWLVDSGIQCAFTHSDREKYFSRLALYIERGGWKTVSATAGSMRRLLTDDIREARKTRPGQTSIDSERKGNDLFGMLLGRIQRDGKDNGFPVGVLVEELDNLFQLEVVSEASFREAMVVLVRTKALLPEVHLRCARRLLGLYPTAKDIRAIVAEVANAETHAETKNAILELLRQADR